MSDEVIVYCYRCGTQVHNDWCHHCKKYGSDNSSTNKRLAEPAYNQREYAIKKCTVYPSQHEQISQAFVCNTCQYIMFHHLVYCFKCGNKFTRVRCTNKEFFEQYGHYKVGY